MNEYLEQLTDWNKNNPIGTHVRITKMDGTVFYSTTTTEAEILGNDVIVVWINPKDDEFPCRLIRYVEPIHKDDIQY